METFDKVDIADNVIGTTNKQLSHQNGDIHRVIAIFAFTSNGDLYMQRHEKSGGLFDHSVGGHVSKGETYIEAAQREGREELGLICPLHEVSIFFSDETYSGLNIKHMFAIYECTVDNNWSFKPNNEVKSIIPMSIKNIINMMNKEPIKFTPGFLNTMREYVKQKHLPYKVRNCSQGFWS